MPATSSRAPGAAVQRFRSPGLTQTRYAFGSTATPFHDPTGRGSSCIGGPTRPSARFALERRLADRNASLSPSRGRGLLQTRLRRFRRWRPRATRGCCEDRHEDLPKCADRAPDHRLPSTQRPGCPLPPSSANRGVGCNRVLDSPKKYRRRGRYTDRTGPVEWSRDWWPHLPIRRCLDETHSKQTKRHCAQLREPGRSPRHPARHPSTTARRWTRPNAACRSQR